MCLLSKQIGWAIEHQDPKISLKDWLTVALAAFALTVSVGVYVFNREKSKQDTFLSIHNSLIALDVQEGRRLLHDEITSKEAADRMRTDDKVAYHKVNRALAMYDVLGLYVKRGYIRKSWVMEEWGPGLAKARVPGMYFIQHRKAQGVPSAWKNFDAISMDAMVLEQNH